MNRSRNCPDACIERKSALASPEFKRSGSDRIECGLIELKFDGSDEKEMTFEGYGAIFGNVDSYGDVISPGAFKASIRESTKGTRPWPAMLSQHGGWGMSSEDLTPIGVWTDMEEDEKGLRLKGKFAPTPRGTEMYTLLKMQPRPAIDGLSIGYIPIKWKMAANADEPRRTLQEVRVIEVSPVTFPANGKARITAAKTEMTKRYAEQALRDVGFSQSEAKAIVATGFKAIGGQRDVDSGLGDIAASLQHTLNLFKG